MWWGRRDCLERALAIQELAYGREHLAVGVGVGELAEVLAGCMWWGARLPGAGVAGARARYPAPEDD